MHINCKFLRCSIYYVASTYNIFANINSINFKQWKNNILIGFGYMDLDLELKEERPPELIKESTSTEKRYLKKWAHLIACLL